MIVCHCRGISDQHIRKAVREGACSRSQVARACQAGSGCGGCGPLVEEIVSCELGAEAAASRAEPALATG